ncbi:putative zinc finger CCCH domain-containing protein 17 [Sesbania bispinosa]|nr:putative zinc finger CCCH domain-containing protein 17 [Sesbania bispinosa]
MEHCLRPRKMFKSHLLVNEEESKTDADGRDIDNTDVAHGQSSEDGMIYDEAAEDQEYEGDDQREGDYDYEQVDEGEYDYDQVDEVKIKSKNTWMMKMGMTLLRRLVSFLHNYRKGSSSALMI